MKYLLLVPKFTLISIHPYTDQAKAKASAIENEAQLLLEKAHMKSREMELNALKEYENAKESIELYAKAKKQNKIWLYTNIVFTHSYDSAPSITYSGCRWSIDLFIHKDSSAFG